MAKEVEMIKAHEYFIRLAIKAGIQVSVSKNVKILEWK